MSRIEALVHLIDWNTNIRIDRHKDRLGRHKDRLSRHKDWIGRQFKTNGWCYINWFGRQKDRLGRHLSWFDRLCR